MDWGTSDKIVKLPKWAQLHISDLQNEINRRDGLVRAHSLLCEEKREWFTIYNHDQDTMRLWLLDRDAPLYSWKG
jgi:hypothetical protein